MEKFYEDQFAKLPDEIVVTILNKLSETHFKYLCQCVSLVSKRFNSLLLRINTISVPLLASQFFLSRPTPNGITFLHFLNRFSQLQSLRLEFGLECIPNQNRFLEWKVNCNTKPQTFVLVAALSICTKNENKGQVEDSENQMTDNCLKYGMLCVPASRYCTEVLLWLVVAMNALRLHPMLRNIKITHSSKQGVLCFNDDKYLESRNMLIERACGKLCGASISNALRIGYLPLSGVVMDGVMVLMFRVGEEAHGDDDEITFYDEILNWEFEDEEKLFGEAVTTIFRNKKNRLFKYRGLSYLVKHVNF